MTSREVVVFVTLSELQNCSCTPAPHRPLLWIPGEERPRSLECGKPIWSISKLTIPDVDHNVDSDDAELSVSEDENRNPILSSMSALSIGSGNDVQQRVVCPDSSSSSS